jgi:hypothetical protein
MAERSIDDRERYVGYATHCLQLAKMATDQESPAVLKEMGDSVGRKLNRVLYALSGNELPDPANCGVKLKQ